MKGKVTKALLKRLELLVVANPNNLEIRTTFETLQTIYDNDNRKPKVTIYDEPVTVIHKTPKNELNDYSIPTPGY